VPIIVGSGARPGRDGDALQRATTLTTRREAMMCMLSGAQCYMISLHPDRAFSSGVSARNDSGAGTMLTMTLSALGLDEWR